MARPGFGLGGGLPPCGGRTPCRSPFWSRAERARGCASSRVCRRSDCRPCPTRTPKPRVRLRAARTAFVAMGAEAFAERARRELLATGEHIGRRGDEPNQLTAQEARIAFHARDGLTNPEIGKLLFVGPRTAVYHLRKVFQKLGIRSVASCPCWRPCRPALRAGRSPTPAQASPVEVAGRRPRGSRPGCRPGLFTGAMARHGVDRDVEAVPGSAQRQWRSDGFHTARFRRGGRRRPASSHCVLRGCLGGPSVGTGRPRALGTCVSVGLPAVRQHRGCPGPDPGDLLPGVPVAGGLLAGHIRRLAASHHHESVPGPGSAPASDAGPRPSAGSRATAGHRAKARSRSMPTPISTRESRLPSMRCRRSSGLPWSGAISKA